MPTVSMIVDFVSAHPGLAYAAVFLLALSEAVPVVGAVVPGSALIIGVAALVPSGAVRFWPLMVVAVLGAIVGDGFSYWLGRHYHADILAQWPLSRYPLVIQKTEAFFHRHGAKSIFLGRFTPAVRAFVPLVAGMARMPGRRFYVANILSALAWAPAHLVPGVLVGASLSLAGALTGRLAILLVALAAIFWLVVWLVRVAATRGLALLSKGEARLGKWARSRDSWLARNVRSLVEPGRGEARVLALCALVVLGAAWAFFAILEAVASGDALVGVDAAVYRILRDLRTPVADVMMIAVTELGDTAVTLPVAIVVLLWLTWQRAWHTAAYWTAAVGFAATLNTAIKIAVHRARPGDLAYSGASEFSFPSGHASATAVMYGFLGLVIARHLRPAWRVPIFTVVGIWTVLMAFSRLYLGAHWLSDVAGSLTFAVAWVILLGIAYFHHHVQLVNPKGLTLIAISALIAVGGFNVYRHHAADTQRYAIQYEEPAITTADWSTTGWQQLPTYRIDLTGEIEEPLTVQWAGTLQSLENRLQQKGWRSPAPWTMPNALLWLATADPLQLPVIPALQAGRLPSLTLIHSLEGEGGLPSRVVLRLWAADLQLRNGGTQMLWVGSAVEERVSRPLSLITIAVNWPNATHPREILAQAMEGSRLARRGPTTWQGEWDGYVLLAREGELQ